MKQCTFKRIAYLFICLFLVCNFFCISGNDADSNKLSTDSSSAIIMQIPNGIHMEIRGERNTTETFIQVKNNITKPYTSFRYLLLLVFFILSVLHFSYTNFYFSKLRSHFSQFQIIQFIHNKDGRKRA